MHIFIYEVYLMYYIYLGVHNVLHICELSKQRAVKSSRTKNNLKFNAILIITCLFRVCQHIYR